VIQKYIFYIKDINKTIVESSSTNVLMASGNMANIDFLKLC